jgi:hypothetical protein
MGIERTARHFEAGLPFERVARVKPWMLTDF